LTDFHSSFTDILSWKFAIKLPHLKCVAALPCEMLMFANRATFCQSLMVSVGVSKLGCTHLIFVDPGVKINGCYYREVLLSQQLLVWRLLGVTTRQCTGAQGTRDNQVLQRETPAFISPDVASE